MRLRTLLLVVLLLTGCRSPDPTVVARPTAQYVTAFESLTCKEKTPGAQYAAVCVDGTHLNSTLAEACDEHGGMYQVIVCPTPRSASASADTPTPDVVLTVEAMATATPAPPPTVVAPAATLPPTRTPTAPAQASPAAMPTAHAQVTPTPPAAGPSATSAVAPSPTPTLQPGASPATTNTPLPAGTTVVAPTATSGAGITSTPATATPQTAALTPGTPQTSVTPQPNVTPQATVTPGPSETPPPNSVAYADIVAQSHALTGAGWTNYKQQLLGKKAYHWVGWVSQPRTVAGTVLIYMSLDHSQYSQWDVFFPAGQDVSSQLTTSQRIEFTGDIEEVRDPLGAVGVGIGLKNTNINNYNPP